jgi:hypothetical protein
MQDVAPQLRESIKSPEVKQLVEEGNLVMKALLVVVGLRQMLLWGMDKDGKLDYGPSLVREGS